MPLLRQAAPEEAANVDASMVEGWGLGTKGTLKRSHLRGRTGRDHDPLPCATSFSPLRTEFGLDALGSGGDTIRAIRELSYKGGNTRTGAALHHVSDRVFLPHLTRPGIPKVLPKPTMPPNVTPK